ncbi:hypothetical protein B0A52_05483 [Exophiala mesophila]|uniref:Major facilitator superfamily (MFS) profile domain-containing protein n=1 Tax=Exophiala mesophila TaxID=212818 RepID=A0A438N322_EXOME|nr:hypothetical protein B0A52_05483 [Exophiala mesophila]
MATPEQPIPMSEKALPYSSPDAFHDEGLKSQEGDDITNDWTEKEERDLVKRIDLRVFPMLCTVFGISLIDRTNVSAAYIAGMDTDIALNVGARYSIALLVFFIGYAICEIPSNMIIRRLGARTWITILTLVWGSIVLAMGFVRSWISLVILRVLLGIFEAGLYPGAVFIIASWYKKFEMAKRISFFFMAALLASGFGPIFAYALSLISVGDGIYSQGWRWIFIIEGIFTIVISVAVPFTLIEFPEKASFLSDRERHIALERLREGRPREEMKHPGVKEVLRMLLDWKLILYCFPYFVCGSSIYAMAYFSPIIVGSHSPISRDMRYSLPGGCHYEVTMESSPTIVKI